MISHSKKHGAFAQKTVHFFTRLGIFHKDYVVKGCKRVTPYAMGAEDLGLYPIIPDVRMRIEVRRVGPSYQQS